MIQPVDTMIQPVGCARVWVAAPPFVSDPMLRQGAWYPVVSTGATRTAVEIRGRRVAVPIALVEVGPRRPHRLTVGELPRDNANPAPATPAAARAAKRGPPGPCVPSTGPAGRRPERTAAAGAICGSRSMWPSPCRAGLLRPARPRG